LANAAAKLAEKNVFPTPPFPLVTAKTLLKGMTASADDSTWSWLLCMMLLTIY
jgi:hypothetical protein